MESCHRTVLLHDAVEGLAPAPQGVYVDATFGGGGHCHLLLTRSLPDGRVIALDRDPRAIARGQGLVERFAGRLTLVQSRFGTLAQVLSQEGIQGVNGVLFDLGVSSPQLDDGERGFSFRGDGPLDMRMGDGGRSAADLVNQEGEGVLADIFFHYGEERHARRVARAVVRERGVSPIQTTARLADIVTRAIPYKGGRIHPATRVFQALRIAVNDELGELRQGLQSAVDCLLPGGRVVVISFHSLEDRIVKHFFRAGAHPPVDPLASFRQPAPPPDLRLITRKPVVPGEAEVRDNPRARSAKMRIAEKLSRQEGS